MSTKSCNKINIVAAFLGMHVSMRDYQESVTTGQTHGQTDTGQSDPYVLLCFAGDTQKYKRVA